MNKKLYTFILINFIAIATYAVEIIPVSYIFDKDADSSSSYTYFDDTGIQLIDGEYGVNPFFEDLGNGPAYEWIGWKSDPKLNIDFDFGEITHVDEIHIGSTQYSTSSVAYPDIYLYTRDSTSSSWNYAGFSLDTPLSSSNNETYRTFEFDEIDLDARYFRARFNSNSRWIFLDEIDFFTNTNDDPTPVVPEPTTFVLFILSIFAFKFKKNKFIRLIIV